MGVVQIPLRQTRFLVSGFLRLLASLRAKANAYQLAAAAVWGIILALMLGLIDYNGTNREFKVADHWFLATVGLSAIMYACLTVLKIAVLVFRGEGTEKVEADD
jgi:hypothetical protein